MDMVKAVERSVIGTRTAIYDLTQPDTGRKIRMFGMVHAGTPSYYEEIQSAMDDCDVVFYEGVKGRITRWVTLVYRIPTWFSSISGLVGQREAIDLSRKADTICHEFAAGLDRKIITSIRPTAVSNPWKRLKAKAAKQSKTNPAKLSMNTQFDISGRWSEGIWTAMQSTIPAETFRLRRLVHADMSGEVFEAGWSKLDWRLRATILVLSPVLGLGLAFSKRLRKWVFESRRVVKCDPDDEDLTAEFMQLVLHDRDKVMIEKIEAFWDAEPDYVGQAAGVFGAAHLPAIINHLVVKRGFQITGSRWVMAIPAQ